MRSGSRDRVVQRAVERRRAGRGRVGVLVGVARFALVAELGEDHEDLVGALAAQLDVLVGGALAAARALDLDDGALALLDGRGGAVQHLLDRRLLESAALVLPGVGELVRPLLGGGVGRLGATRSTVGWAPTMGAPTATPMPAARARLSSPLDVLRTDPPRLAAVVGRRSARCAWPDRGHAHQWCRVGAPPSNPRRRMAVTDRSAPEVGAIDFQEILRWRAGRSEEVVVCRVVDGGSGAVLAGRVRVPGRSVVDAASVERGRRRGAWPGGGRPSCAR